ncbi:Asp23/Gls24 family envelope stress response protein [Streptomyces sp. P38-E01]|uniref:Asp23/Gls24 family envelope stress response protein n=1 Tax=Streptomyces tardus TaxID=2780544 RepID=A0A949JE66_9ACTN|nr:Asp23/Gls24 family envelope stress response protein [Streptomyces tardus]MBU7596834.1 Asp23/Gls24 family envelope stress response protein [Streptomyces tardus]
METDQYRTSQARKNGESGAETVGGRTAIADVVVESIAGIAAREADGVYSMGGGVSRAVGAVRNRLQSGEDSARGVDAEVGEKQAAVDISLVVEYGAIITDTARQIRSKVSRTVKEMTGLEVVEINIYVLDVHVPDTSEKSEGSGGSESSGGSRRDDRSTSTAGDRSRVQ